MSSRILVPLDGSKVAEQVLTYVRSITYGAKVPVELLRVFSPASPELADSEHGHYLDQIDASLGNQAQDYLNTVKNTMFDAAAQVSCAVEEGEAASCIARAGENQPNTLIFVIGGLSL